MLPSPAVELVNDRRSGLVLAEDERERAITLAEPSHLLPLTPLRAKWSEGHEADSCRAEPGDPGRPVIRPRGYIDDAMVEVAAVEEIALVAQEVAHGLVDRDLAVDEPEQPTVSSFPTRRARRVEDIGCGDDDAREHARCQDPTDAWRTGEVIRHPDEGEQTSSDRHHPARGPGEAGRDDGRDDDFVRQSCAAERERPTHRQEADQRECVANRLPHPGRERAAPA